MSETLTGIGNVTNTKELIEAANQTITTFKPPKDFEDCAWVGSSDKAQLLNLRVADLRKLGEKESIQKGYPGGTLGNYLSSEIYPPGTPLKMERYISSLCVANTLKILAKPKETDDSKYLVSNDTTAGFEVENGINLSPKEKKILAMVSPVLYSPTNKLSIFAFDTSIDSGVRTKAAKLLIRKVSTNQKINVCLANSTMFVPTSFLGDSIDLHDLILEPYSCKLDGFALLMVTISATCNTEAFLNNLENNPGQLPLGQDFGQLVKNSVIQPKSINIAAAEFAARTSEAPGNKGFKFSSYTTEIKDRTGFGDFFFQVGHGPVPSLIKSFA